MLFLIPPSEGKTAAVKGPKLNLKKLPFPELTAKRDELIDALSQLCAKQPKKAAALLELGPTQHDLLELNSALRTQPCAAAIDIYTGVLFDHFDYSTLSSRGKVRANNSILIASALFGFVRPDSPIPSYRLSGSTVLPTIGPLAKFWKPELGEILAAHDSDLVIDMRSGTYAKLAPIPKSDSFIEVKVMTRVKGVLKSVTHFNKATKGDILRASFQSTIKPPASIAGTEKYFRALGFDASLAETKSGHAELVIVTE